ncbi:prephenate dehydratase [Reyranella sp.]|uniref:prephenate dehydratase n=1 Tax=Reyranella sp. TaxID=1929291 RepID=UPI001204F3FD|nr:prephenate dehydratase [Reyranella sp.]TAJ82193.1 MAG: prephenate dehydratase [Reyranella sp.]
MARQTAKTAAKTRGGKAAASNIIAFQGEPGANSDMACRAAFPYMTTLPCPTFDTAMGAVQAGKAELAIIPVENSIAGRVADLHSLLPHTKLKIVAEHFQRVEHCLVALPGASLKSIKTVKSHVQALAQCRNFLKKHRFQPLVHADTAGAAREIAEIGDPKVGAIASSLAARIYDLKVLAKNIEDADHNTTRMLVFSRDQATLDWRTVQCMTAFLFRVKSRPAALYKALGGFATNGVNIVKLESYLSGARFEQAQFYAEVEGHPEQRSVHLALEELGFFSEELKLLGTFPTNPFRRKGWDAPTRPGT